MDIIYYILLTLFLILSVFLILLVLIQKGRGGGLSAAFGGGGGGNTAFGAKTGDVLTWATSIVFGVFIILGISLNLLANSIHVRNTTAKVTTATSQPADTTSSSLPDPTFVPKADSTDASGLKPSTQPAGAPASSTPAPASTQPSTQPTK